MTPNIQYYTVAELAAKAGTNYQRVLFAIRDNTLPASKIGVSYVVQAHEGDTWIEQERLRADPHALQKLQAEISALRAENRALRAGRV